MTVRRTHPSDAQARVTSCAAASPWSCCYWTRRQPEVEGAARRAFIDYVVACREYRDDDKAVIAARQRLRHVIAELRRTSVQRARAACAEAKLAAAQQPPTQEPADTEGTSPDPTST